MAPREGDQGVPCRVEPRALFPGLEYRELDTTYATVFCGLDLGCTAQITGVKQAGDPKRTGHSPTPFGAIATNNYLPIVDGGGVSSGQIEPWVNTA